MVSLGPTDSYKFSQYFLRCYFLVFRIIGDEIIKNYNFKLLLYFISILFIVINRIEKDFPSFFFPKNHLFCSKTFNLESRSQQTIPTLTERLKECLEPNCGISMTWSLEDTTSC